jgi:uncharacterized repeat protein (TIGR01451 family)
MTRATAKFGVLLLILLSAFTAALAQVAPTGSSISNTAYVSYTDNSGRPVNNIPSNMVITTVAQVTAGQLLQDQNITAPPGVQVILQHHLNDVGSTSDTYYISLISVAVGQSNLRVTGKAGQTADFQLSNLAVYFDANNNGVVDPGEEQLTPNTPLQLTAGQSASLLIVGTVPASATVGQLAIVQIQADDLHSSPLVNTDTVTVVKAKPVGPPEVGLAKSANVSSAKPGQSIQYTLQLANIGIGDAAPSSLIIDNATVPAVYIVDEIPANTQFSAVTAPSSGTVFYHANGTPAGQYTAKAPSSANIDFIGFAVPDLASQQSYSFSFTVNVNSDASGNVSNTANVTFVNQTATQTVNSNTVSVTVPVVPPTIGFYRDTTFATPAQVASIGGTVHIQATAASCNLDPTVVEKHMVTITTNQTHDLEQFMAVETGPNTGIFQIQNVPVADAHTTPVVQNDGTLEVYRNELLTATITGCGGGAASAVATILIDPYGVVFDSHSDTLIAQAQVTLIDVTGQGNGGHPGQPATVLQSDYKTPAPSTVTTGTDGSYQFPVVAPSTYKVSITPPNGYKFPSTVAPTKLPQDRTILQPASYGGNFIISSSETAVNFDVPLDPGPLFGFFISKSADETQVEAGSSVGYSLEVKNNTGQVLPAATVVDTLPQGFMYELHSATLGGKKLADPAGGKGPVLTFSIGDLAVDADVIIHYYVRLLPQANNNNVVNKAFAVSGVTKSNTATASVRIFGGVFDTRGVIIGKVYADCNGNGLQDADEPGVPGVRVYLDNGTFAVTDGAGKFSIFGVTPRLHGLKLDSYTLPPGFTPEISSNRNAGDGGSLFIDMVAAEMHRADFPLSGCSNEAMKGLEARRKDQNEETAALLKKTPQLDRTTNTLEARRGAAVSGLVDSGAPGSTGAPGGMSGATSAANIPGNTTDGAASPLAPASMTAANSPAIIPVAAVATPAAAEPQGKMAIEVAKNETNQAEMQNGLRVVRLIRPEMSNDFDFIGLRDGQIVSAAQMDVALKGVLGTDFVLYLNGQKISTERIAQKSTEASKNLQAWLYMGMELHPGKNLLEAKMIDPFGNERAARKLYITAPGALARVVAEPSSRTPVADGRTPVHVSVRLVDADGIPVSSRTPVTLETTVGKWDAQDLNPKEPGTQVFVEGGSAEFDLIPPTEPTDGKITISSGMFSWESKLSFMPELRPLMGIGVVDQTLSFRRFTGANAHTIDFYSLESDVNRLAGSANNGQVDYTAHVGTLLKGRVWGDTLMTLAYDSDKQSGDPMFRDSQTDDYYLVYGDSSVRGYDAQSTSRLYLRFDRGKNYIMYGDYNTGDSQNPAKVLSNVNRSFTGLRLHGQDSLFDFTGFTTHDSVKQYVEEIPANGSSGPYLIAHMDLVLNSETVEILVRDRNQPALILQDTAMNVMTDYEFDTLTGAIIFKQPIPSHDSSMNPISIRVTYEFDAGGPRYWMSGGDGSIHLDRLRIGGSFYDDKTPMAGLRLWGTNGTYAWNKDTTLVGEFARTWTPTLGDGNAEHFEFKQKTSTLDSRVYFGRTDLNFDNPNAMLNQGRGESGANITWKVQPHMRLHFEMIRSEAVDTGSAQTGIYATMQRDITQMLSTEFGYRYAGAMSASTIAASSTSSTTSTTTTSSSSTTSTTSSTSTSTAANDDLYLKLSIKPPELRKLSLYGEYEDDMADYSKRELAVGGNYQFSDKGKFYVRHELISSLGNLYQLNGQQQQNSTVFGIDTTYLKNDHVFTEYRGTDAFSGRETEAALGLRNVYTLRPGLKLSASAESVKTLSGTTNDNALALTGGLEYTAAARWKSSGRFEWRQSDTSDSILSTYGLAIKLSDSYTLLNRSIYSLTIPKTSGETDRLQMRIQNGVSFRPNHSNRLTLLAMAELKEEKDGTQTVVIPDRKVGILSLAGNYLASQKLTLSARYATKWSNDVTNVTDSTLDGHMVTLRAMYDITRNWTAGYDFGGLFSNSFKNVEFANGVELGRVLRKNLWLSVGYNYTGFYDRDLTGDEATRRGPFVRLRFKFDEAMFPFLKSEGQR